MLVHELKEKLNLEAVHLCEKDCEISGCYIGDMLSVVMSKAEEGNVWLTVQANVNTTAVAVLTGISCIIIVEGIEPDPETINKARAQGVTIFKSPKTAYELACQIEKLI